VKRRIARIMTVLMLVVLTVGLPAVTALASNTWD
jgi:hypothetical protein